MTTLARARLRIPSPRGVSDVLNGGVLLLAWLVLAVAVGVPLYAYWRAAQPPPAVSERVYVPPTPRAAVPVLPATVKLPAGVPVLAYDDVAPRGSAWAVTPRRLDAQLAALRASGFHAVSAAQVERWVAGRGALPARPVLLTFDGGTKSIWRYADGVLARYGMRGVVLPVTGRVGTHQPYYLNWAELRAMRATGRWDVGSHTRAGAGQIQVNPAGRLRGFMTNLQWLRGRYRRESLAQYRARVGRDLDGSIRDLTRHGLPRPALLSFPHTLEHAMPNDSRVPAALDTVVRARFPLALDTVSHPAFARTVGPERYLDRISVKRGMTAAQLLQQIVYAGRRTDRVGTP